MKYKKVICVLAVSAALAPTCSAKAAETDSTDLISDESVQMEADAEEEDAKNTLTMDDTADISSDAALYETSGESQEILTLSATPEALMNAAAENETAEAETEAAAEQKDIEAETAEPTDTENPAETEAAAEQKDIEAETAEPTDTENPAETKADTSAGETSAESANSAETESEVPIESNDPVTAESTADIVTESNPSSEKADVQAVSEITTTDTEVSDVLEISEEDISTIASAVQSSWVQSAATTEKMVFEYLTGKCGLNRAAACGIMANMYAESGFLLNNLENSKEEKLGYTDASYTAAVDNGSYSNYNFIHDGAGYGLVQWTFWTGKQGLLQAAQSNKLSISNFNVQMQYLYQTMQEYGILAELKTVSNTAEGAYTAGNYFCTMYERPPQTSTSAVVRGNLAKTTFWTKYGTSTAASTTGTSSTGTTATNTTQSVTSQSSQTGTAYTVTASCLNVRDAASMSGSVIGGIYANTKVTVLSVSNGFGKINYNGKTGYISMDYCTKTTSAASSSTSTAASTAGNSASGTASSGTSYTVTASALNIRSGAGTSYGTIGSYSQGTTVKVYEVSNGWGKVYCNGTYGWVSLDYCKSTSSTSASTITAATTAAGSSSVYTVTASALNVRNTPSMYGTVKGSLTSGTKVTVKSITGNWGLISYNGTDAYICMDYCVK